MTKCRIIDRIAYTKGDVKFLEARDYSNHTDTRENEHTGDICPRCKQHTLRHIEGCERCPSCGYDACAWGEV